MAEEGFFSQVYDVVGQIPPGRVSTYGQIASMLGNVRRARSVGFALHASPGIAGGVPCHRVVFKDGRLAPGFAFGGPDRQRVLLEEEGVEFLDDGTVDMAACLWEV